MIVELLMVAVGCLGGMTIIGYFYDQRVKENKRLSKEVIKYKLMYSKLYLNQMTEK